MKKVDKDSFWKSRYPNPEEKAVLILATALEWKDNPDYVVVSWKNQEVVRSNSGLAKIIARIQNINPSGGGEFIQVETPEWCPKGTELISQVQIKLRGGAIITNSEFGVSDLSGNRVVTRINHIHAPT